MITIKMMKKTIATKMIMMTTKTIMMKKKMKIKTIIKTVNASQIIPLLLLLESHKEEKKTKI